MEEWVGGRGGAAGAEGAASREISSARIQLRLNCESRIRIGTKMISAREELIISLLVLVLFRKVHRARIVSR